MVKKERKEEYQKLFVYSSKERKEQIDELLKDKAKAENKTVSAIIEETLLESFMPANEKMRDFILDLYQTNPDRNGVHFAISNIMAYNSASAEKNKLVRHTNFLPLVEFMYEESVCFNVVPSKKQMEYYHFISQLDTVCSALLKTDIRESQKEYINFLLSEAKEEPEFSHFGRFLRLIIEYWNLLADNPATYKMLMDIADMSKSCWQKDSRRKLYQILCTMAEEW